MSGNSQVVTLQNQVDRQAEKSVRGFGTFDGVFTPTLLTIVGVILFLRLGWVVGNAGLVGAWVIIALAGLITVSTALSMSAITSNIRIGAGGAFSIISQSLGLEVGGSVGIPLYLCQALAVAMYIIGFRAGWLELFPLHPPLLVDLLTFAAMLVIGMISANFAFRVQFVILAILVGALASVFAALGADGPRHVPQFFGHFPGAPETGFGGTSFWFVFAVFFPAVTGIMAGANMSGELRNPRRSIPKGTLWAVGVTTVLYLVLAWWCSVIASPEELVGNYKIMIEKAVWPPLVTAGLLGATFSSGLASLVGAPRILQALGQHNILPGSAWFAARAGKSREPRHAMAFTGAIVLGALLLRDLNAIAPLVTMFFLIAYLMLNVVMLIEQNLGLVSFRPLFRVPPVVPLAGTLGCGVTMFVINPLFGLGAVSVVVAFYAFLVRRQLKAPFGDVRSGLFGSLAEWAARRVMELPPSTERTWKPNLLVPVEDGREIRGVFHFLRDLTKPYGSMKLLGLTGTASAQGLQARLPELSQAFRDEGLYTTWTVVESPDFEQGLTVAFQALRGAFFRPNVVFLFLPEAESERDEQLRRVIQKAREQHLGVLLLYEHPRSHLGFEQSVQVWIRDQSPDWSMHMQLGNLDTALLFGHLVRKNWTGRMGLITAVSEPENRDSAREFLTNLLELARLPEVQVHAEVGRFPEVAERAPEADLNILGLPDEVDLKFARETVARLGTSCLFVRDSGDENVLA